MNCSFKMLASLTLSLYRIPSFRKETTSDGSALLIVMNHQNFFGFVSQSSVNTFDT